MSWNSYNAFMDGIGKGHHLVPVLAVLAILVILALAMTTRSRRGKHPS